MPDIADQLDAAIGAAPPEAPGIDTTLVLGRRALLRRRLAYGTGAVTTALVIGGTAWAVSPGDNGSPRTDEPGFAGSPSVSPSNSDSPSPSDSPSQPQDAGGIGAPWLGPDAARLAAPGRVEVKPGWTVTEDLSHAGRWWAVEVAKGDRLQWFLFGDAMSIGNAHAPALGYDSFQEWVDVNAPLLDDQGANDGQDDEEWPGVPRDDLVRFSEPDLSLPEPGTLVPLQGVEIVDQRPGVDLGESFAGPGDVTGVALVTSAGSRTFVVARAVDGGPAEYIAVPATSAMDTLDEFIAFAEERYAEGGGGLL